MEAFAAVLAAAFIGHFIGDLLFSLIGGIFNRVSPKARRRREHDLLVRQQRQRMLDEAARHLLPTGERRLRGGQ